MAEWPRSRDARVLYNMKSDQIEARHSTANNNKPPNQHCDIDGESIWGDVSCDRYRLNGCHAGPPATALQRPARAETRAPRDAPHGASLIIRPTITQKPGRQRAGPTGHHAHNFTRSATFVSPLFISTFSTHRESCSDSIH